MYSRGDEPHFLEKVFLSRTKKGFALNKMQRVNQCLRLDFLMCGDGLGEG